MDWSLNIVASETLCPSMVIRADSRTILVLLFFLRYPSMCPSGAEARLDIEWMQEILRAFILSVSKLIFMHSENN